MTQSILARGLDQIHGLLASVTPEDAALRTPCAEWTVSDLSDHIVNSTAGMATMAQGGQPDWSSAPRHDDPASALRAVGATLVEAAAESDGAFPDGLAAAELAVHAYDLATALGRPTADLDPEIAEAGFAFMSQSMSDDKRGDAFGPEQPAPAHADAYQRLAAFAGRRV